MATFEDDKIYAAIGRITTWSTELEYILEVMTGSLINDYQCYARVITTELSFNGVISLLLSLYRQRYGEDLQFNRLQELLNKANVAQEKRNSIVHSIWRSAGTPDKITRIKSTAKAKRGFSTQIENWSFDQFNDLVADFRTLINELNDLLDELISTEKAFDNPVFPTLS